MDELTAKQRYNIRHKDRVSEQKKTYYKKNHVIIRQVQRQKYRQVHYDNAKILVIIQGPFFIPE